MNASPSLDDILDQSDVQDAVAGKVASAIAGGIELASAATPIRAGVASAIQAASATPATRLGVASAAAPSASAASAAAGPITAASPTPIGGALAASAIAAASPIPGAAAASGLSAGMVSSAAVDAFASAIAARLGFASSADRDDILSVFASRVASVVGEISQFSPYPAVASSIGAVVASTVGRRILASAAGSDFIAQRLTGVASAATPLTRRPSPNS